MQYTIASTSNGLKLDRMQSQYEEMDTIYKFYKAFSGGSQTAFEYVNLSVLILIPIDR